MTKQSFQANKLKNWRPAAIINKCFIGPGKPFNQRPLQGAITDMSTSRAGIIFNHCFNGY